MGGKMLRHMYTFGLVSGRSMVTVGKARMFVTEKMHMELVRA